MSWSKAVSEARYWATSNSLGFVVASEDEKSRRIIFKGSSASFYVTVPDSENLGRSDVWSEDDRCIKLLLPHLESATSRQRSMIEMLQDVALCLSSSDSQKAEQDDDEVSDGEDDDDTYYNEGDEFLESKSDHSTEEASFSAKDFFTGQGSPVAVHRLLADLTNFTKSSSRCGISGRPRGDKLFVWDVELSDFEPKSLLGKDLAAYAHKYRRKPVIEVEMQFPKEYPMFPPFVRVIRPRFKFLTGHVTIGGSICMEMLTRSGWTPSNDIEGILVQVRAEIMSDLNAQLDPHNPDQEYSESEAKTAFERMVQKYGWNR
ncbi:hypothetical protein EMCRGX_G030918 [Ephydatia muelleri]